MRVLRVSQPLQSGQRPATMVVGETSLNIPIEQALKEQIALTRGTPIELEAYYAIFEWPDSDADNITAMTLRAEQDLRNQMILRRWLIEQISRLAHDQGIQTTQPAPLSDDVLEYELKLVARRAFDFGYNGQPINLIAKDGTRISLVGGKVLRPQPGELELLFAESMIERASWRPAHGTPPGVTAYEAEIEAKYGPSVKLMVGSDGRSIMGTMVVGGSIIKLPDKLAVKAFDLAERHWLSMQNP